MDSLPSSRASMEEKLRLAAFHGQRLEEKVKSLESKLEDSLQTNHELSLKLERQTQLVHVLTEESESLRDASKVLVSERTQREKLEKENIHLKNQVDHLTHNVQLLEESNGNLKRKLDDALSTPNALNNDESSHEDKDASMIIQLHSDKQDLENECQRLKLEVDYLKEEAIAKDSSLEVSEMKRKQLGEMLEEKERESSSNEELVSHLRERIATLEEEIAELGVTNSLGNEKGNSIFAEVEDRRHKVEIKLKHAIEEKQQLKKHNNRLIQLLKKAKMDNVALMNCGSGGHSQKEVARLENLLLAEKNRYQDLNETLQKLTKITKSDVREVGFSKKACGEHGKSCTCCASLAFEKDKCAKLLEQYEKETRQHMIESDQLLEMSRKITNLEGQIKKLQTENYQLKSSLNNKKESQENVASGTKVKSGLVEKLPFKENRDPNVESVSNSGTEKLKKESDCDATTGKEEDKEEIKSLLVKPHKKVTISDNNEYVEPAEQIEPRTSSKGTKSKVYDASEEGRKFEEEYCATQ